MKKHSNHSFIQTALKAGVCIFALSGTTHLMAQEDMTAETDTVEATRIKPAKKVPQYKMRTVKGTIYDAATKGVLSGVRVQAFGYPAYSALTEEDGSYSLRVPTFVHAIYVDAPDFNPIQIAIKDSLEQNGELHSSLLKGFYKPETVITARNKADIDNSSSLSIETDIQNTLAGDIRTINRSGLPAQGAFMHIQGIHSLNATVQPLIIVDGVMMDMQENRTSLHEGFYNNLLAGIDPEDIESVEVLKNATALYGAKGANGVILITTKRGRSMATKINVRIFGGFELKPNTLDMMNGEQFRSYVSDLTGTTPTGQAWAENNRVFPFLNDNKDYYWYPMFHNETDWSDGLYRTAFTQNYKVNVEGGDEVAMYNLSLGYASSQSTGEGTDFNRLNLRFNSDIKITETLKTAIDFSYNRMAYNVLDNGWSANYDDQNIGSPNVLGLIQTPFLNKNGYYMGTDNKLHLSNILAGKYAADESLTNSPSIDNPFNYASQLADNTVLNNPYWILENGDGKEKNYAELTQFSINVRPRWEITKQLAISDRFSYTLNRNNERYYIPRYGSSPYYLENLGYVNSVIRSQFSKEVSLNNDLRIEWGNQYGAHTIKAFGGWRYNNYSYSYTYLGAYNNQNDKITNLAKSTIYYPTYDGTNDNWVDMSYYANVDYNFRNKYYAQASVGIQSSSRFGKDTDDGFQLGGVSWGVFPSLQLGWVISSESWFPTKGVNYLKLTAGVDQSGNDDLNYYATRTYWSARRYLNNAIGLVMENVENPKLQWETTTRYNVALEGSFINNRLSAGLNLFWAKTDNLLVMKDISYLTGLDKYWTNEGTMTNRGFELNANAVLIDKRNWKWQVGASVGHYNNKITELPSNAWDASGRYNGYTASIYGDNNILTAVGYSAGVFYGYQTAGVFASDQAAKCYTNPTTGEAEYLKYPTGSTNEAEKYKYFKAGDMHFVDLNNDGIIDDNDKTVIGDPNPDIFGNLFTSLSYKNLRLDVTFKYSLGNDVYNYQRSQIEAGSNFYNQTTAMVNRWTTEGQAAVQPRACATNSEEWVNNERFSDRWIEDGSYLKLKNVRLTYTVPVPTSWTWLQGIKVWGEGNNLLTVSRYLGTDPESSCNNNIFYQGIDNGLIPLSRSFNIGFTINL